MSLHPTRPCCRAQLAVPGVPKHWRHAAAIAEDSQHAALPSDGKLQPDWPAAALAAAVCAVGALWLGGVGGCVNAWLLWQLGTRDSRGCHCCVEYHAPTAVLRLASDPQLWGARVTPVPKTAPLQINLIGNQLTGGIPDEWTKLPSLAIMSACAVQLWPRSSPDPFLAIMSVCAVQICPSSPLSCNPACNPAWSLAICALSAAIQRRHSAAPGVGRAHL